MATTVTTGITLTPGHPQLYQGAGGTLTNPAGVVVTNTYATGFVPVVYNKGALLVGSGQYAGVELRPASERAGVFGGFVFNGATGDSTALIDGGAFGVRFDIGSTAATKGSINGYVSNLGTIEIQGNGSPITAGVYFGAGVGGKVNNAGVIIDTLGSGADIYFKTGTGTSPNVVESVINSGTLLSAPGHPSIEMINSLGSVSVDNTGSGFISNGIFAIGATTNIVNAGYVGSSGVTVGGKVFAILGGVGTLTLDAGQKLGGAAYFGAGSTLDLAAGAPGTIGTLHAGNYGVGTYAGFKSLTIQHGADWSIGGSVSSVASITDLGTLNVTGSLGATSIDLGGNGAASVLNTTLGNDFSPDATFFNEPVFNQTITDFGGGDVINIAGVSLSGTPGIFYNNGELKVVGTAHTYIFDVTGIPGSTLTASNFSVSSGSKGLQITEIPCFKSGTRILTGNGQVAVESLRVGDHVLTVRDGSAQEIIWVGQRTIDLSRHANPEKVTPVRIIAGAFGAGLPERDLVVSPDHALFLEEHLVEAKTLVNGATIIWDRASRYVTYHHIELARHDVLLAEGLPAESYLESGNRASFEQDHAPMILHPDFAAQSREKACAALLLDGPVVMSIRQTLLDRAVALGFTKTDALDLTAKVGGETLKAEPGEMNEILFVLPAGTKVVSLISTAGVPAELTADPADRRVLGAAITGLALVANGQRREILLDDAAHEGFHPAEANHRWTDGNARIVLPAYTGRAVLEVTLNGQAARWSNTSQLAAHA